MILFSLVPAVARSAPTPCNASLQSHAVTARQSCPSLTKKIVTPHKLRHAAAMELLHHGVDLSVIALWLGHESRETTEIYLHADMNLKEHSKSSTQDRR
jgi:site-specific recombinase XerD